MRLTKQSAEQEKACGRSRTTMKIVLNVQDKPQSGMNWLGSIAGNGDI